MNRADVFAHIEAERARQAEKWGGLHPWGEGDCSSSKVRRIVKAAVLAEECGEVSRAVLDHADDADLFNELVQVAAVAVAWMESIP